MSGINSLKNHFSFSWLLKNVFLFIAKSCLVYEKALQIIAFSPKWTGNRGGEEIKRQASNFSTSNDS